MDWNISICAISKRRILHDRHVFLAGFAPNLPDDGRLLMFDARDPAMPRLVSRLSLPGLVGHVSASDDLLFASSERLHVLRFGEARSLDVQIYLPRALRGDAGGGLP